MGISHTLMIEPKVLVPMLEENGYLPTQLAIGEEPYLSELDETIPYYKEMVSMVQFGRHRPSVAEYPEVAEHICQAIEDVYYGLKDPKQALDEAAAKSVEVLGW
jgi:multiple sugar transport system substrate-binding protein